MAVRHLDRCEDRAIIDDVDAQPAPREDMAGHHDPVGGAAEDLVPEDLMPEDFLPEDLARHVSSLPLGRDDPSSTRA